MFPRAAHYMSKCRMWLASRGLATPAVCRERWRYIGVWRCVLVYIPYIHTYTHTSHVTSCDGLPIFTRCSTASFTYRSPFLQPHVIAFYQSDSNSTITWSCSTVSSTAPIFTSMLNFSLQPQSVPHRKHTVLYGHCLTLSATSARSSKKTSDYQCVLTPERADTSGVAQSLTAVLYTKTCLCIQQWTYRQCTHNAILRRVRVTTVAVEKQ
jgi:hypothetical protein